MSNPQDEYGLLLDYFGLEKSELVWTFNKEKGFHCLSYPVNYCLGKKLDTGRSLFYLESRLHVYWKHTLDTLSFGNTISISKYGSNV